MDNIIIKEIHDFTEKQLEELFLSVGWSSGHYPNKLKIAMQNYETVYSAWDDEKLIGLICAMDDGIMTAYVHYLLLRPEYQGQGIGKALVKKIKNIILRICGLSWLHIIKKSDFMRTADS